MSGAVQIDYPDALLPGTGSMLALHAPGFGRGAGPGPTLDWTVDAVASVGTSQSRPVTPRPGSPVEIMVPISALSCHEPLATAPVSPCVTPASGSGRSRTSRMDAAASARAVRVRDVRLDRTTTSAALKSQPSEPLFIPPHVPETDAGILPTTPALRVADNPVEDLPAPEPSRFLQADADSLALTASLTPLEHFPLPASRGASCAEHVGQDPLFTAFEEFMSHRPGKDIPAPQHSAPWDPSKVDYNRMIDQLVDEADHLDFQFATHLSLGDELLRAEYGVEGEMLVADGIEGEGIPTVEVQAGADMMAEGTAGVSEETRWAKAAGKAGEGEKDGEGAMETEDASESSDVSVELRGRVTRRAVAGHALLGRAALKVRKAPKEKKKVIKPRNFCRNCGAMSTPQWRCGPEGPRTLCNACGVRWRKGLPLKPKEEQPPAPTWDDEETFSDDE